MPAGRPKRETLQIAKEEGKKRGRGRPRKEDIVVKPLVVHDRPDIKEKNKLKYAEDTVKRAEKLYKRYSKPFPNPLNIDEKDLEPEARTAWECVYSMRDQETIGKNEERVFHSADEILFMFDCFIQYIYAHNFVKGFVKPDGEEGVMPIVPNEMTFSRWLGVGYNTLDSIMQRASDEVRKKYRQMLSNVLSQGAIIGAYQQSSTIFALKNMCDWADKIEDRTTVKNESLGVEEARQLMSDLGYTKKLDELKALDALQAPKGENNG